MPAVFKSLKNGRSAKHALGIESTFFFSVPPGVSMHIYELPFGGDLTPLPLSRALLMTPHLPVETFILSVNAMFAQPM